jgi:hypothetical protein
VISSSLRSEPDNTKLSKQTSIPLVGFEPTISEGEPPQTYALGYGYFGARTDITQHNSLDRLQIRKWKSKTLLFMIFTFAPCMLVYLFYSNQVMHSF